jgi:hypothetical protein
VSTSDTADGREPSDDTVEPLAPADPADDSASQIDAPVVGDGAIARQHPVFVYTMLRVAMLAAVGAVFYLLGVRGVWLILFAFLVSGLLSAVVLRRPREGAVLGFTSAYKGINARIDATTRAEDGDDDLDESASGTEDRGPTTS